MSAIPKLPSADRRQSFRRRLQRALALSPSKSEDPRSDSGLVAGDTTEEEIHQEQNDCYSRQEWGTTLGRIEEGARPDRDTGPNSGKERETPAQIDASETAT
ncbi:hypothetical protein N7523_002069 [Penicillium sp. IBT 18751x]|nr:hypothetical protein N7523_002021 [Penicillium sp. IBT 18751x]KAJ6126428.1 hypothetical protein N7523_002040 [Penicillium sp. IBT 18751x]KAJ6126457.1 hypothetical protein N7523_002069 [Penicillium sp. IBT 18751x]